MPDLTAILIDPALVSTSSYALFLLITLLTVLTPGPGVLMTLTNAMLGGARHALGGISGIAVGTVLVASISATGLALILSTSSLVLPIIKYLGAAYLLYLGIRLWRSPSLVLNRSHAEVANWKRQFLEGIALQLTNPKALIFFISVFPQFVDAQYPFAAQFALLVATYGLTVMIVHVIYAQMAAAVCNRVVSSNGWKKLNRIGGGIFVGMGVGLAGSGS